MESNNIEKVMLNILSDAQKGLLSKRNWKKYGCESEDDFNDYITAAVKLDLITISKKPSNFATGGRGNKPRIEIENESDYHITTEGRNTLQEQ